MRVGAVAQASDCAPRAMGTIVTRNPICSFAVGFEQDGNRIRAEALTGQLADVNDATVAKHFVDRAPYLKRRITERPDALGSIRSSRQLRPSRTSSARHCVVVSSFGFWGTGDAERAPKMISEL